MTDRIAYVLITEPGGIDGRDHMDKGGKIMHATWEEPKKKAPWCRLEKQVIEVEAAKKSALAKLDPIDRLVLGI